MSNKDQLVLMQQELNAQLEHAAYLLRRTYPLIQEQKLFIEVFKILVQYYQDYESYLLERLKLEGLISKLPSDKVEYRRLLLSNRFKIKKIINPNFELTSLIAQKLLLQELLEAQKTGPADSARKKDYIICEKNYKVRVISESSAHQTLCLAEEFGSFL